MRFSPKTEAEIAAEKAKFGPWPRGAYDFEVLSAEEATSSNNNEMIVLEIMAYDSHGNKRKLKDWLVEAMQVKLKEACQAVGLHDAYDAGTVAAHDFVGRTGQVRLTIEAKEGFDARNKVSGYVPAARTATPRRSIAQPAKREPATAGGGRTMQDLNDEIPFGPCWQ